MDGLSNRRKTAPYTHITIRKEKRKKKNGKNSNKKKALPPNPASCHRHVKIISPRHQHERGRPRERISLPKGSSHPQFGFISLFHFRNRFGENDWGISKTTKEVSFFHSYFSFLLVFPPPSRILKRSGPNQALWLSHGASWYIHYLSTKSPHLLYVQYPLYALVRIPC